MLMCPEPNFQFIVRRSLHRQPGQLCLEKSSVKPRKRERNNMLSSSHRDVGRLHDFSKLMREFSDKSKSEFWGFIWALRWRVQVGTHRVKLNPSFPYFLQCDVHGKKEKPGGYPTQIFCISSVTTTAQLRAERNLIVHFLCLN